MLDLTDWDEDRDGTVKLSGDWAFYWNRLLYDRDVADGGSSAKPDGYFAVPNVWNNYKINEKSLPGYGYATYRLQVKLREAPKEMALNIPTLSTAYRVMIDGETVAVGGQVAETSLWAEADYAPQTVVFQPSAAEFDIIVQISNFLYARGGMWYELELGTDRQIAILNRGEYGMDMIVLGSAFMIGIYHFVIYLFRRTNRSALYFSICCLFVVLRMLVVDELYITFPFPDIPVRLLISLEYLTYYGGVLLTALFIRELYPLEFRWRYVNAVIGIAGAFLLGAFVFPAEVYTQWIVFFHYFAFLCCLYFISGIVLAVGRKREGALLQLVGVLLFILTMIHDILYNANLIQWIDNQMVPFGMFLLIFIEAAELARRFSNAYRTIETMSAKLVSVDKLKDEFLANTSHELKTPIHGVMNLSQSVLDKASDRLTLAEAENLKTVVSVSRRLSHLINDILDWSKLKNKEIALRRKAVGLQPLVSVVLDMFRHLAGGKPVVFVDQLPKDLPDADADEDRLTQILYNLIGNAVKFTSEGEIGVSAREQDGWIEISVRDTGIGIPQNMRGIIFESFEQTGKAIAAEYGGTGLGLSITKRLVELHGGKLGVESVEGIGSVFTFTVPAMAGTRPRLNSPLPPLAGDRLRAMSELSVSSDMAAEPANSKRDSIPLERESEYTILVADDDPVNRQVLISLLSDGNCSVVAASDGIEAIDALQRRRFDLAVIDLMMPGKSGYEVCRSIRERFSLSELPVLLLTARNQSEDILTAFQAGVNDFVSKPVESGELKARIRTLLELKTSAAEMVHSEMAFLQAQIKPHFLFNALTTIMSVSYTDVDKAQELLGSLSEYLRNSFDFHNREKLVPLRKELQLIESYLKIEHARFGNRLETVLNMEADTGTLVPPLVIQPIVENAVRHGAMGQARGGTVKVSIKSCPDHIEVIVTDDGPGMPQEKLAMLKEQRIDLGGVGLLNIERRLLNMYGQGLEIASRAGQGTSVTLRIPERSN
ncbi:hybrid sensor histidine kinase/response regulator [Paenibacillus oceani]|uniref:histidine kinase n=1 Tax=Paenibacillus oceani TaxID=2772510 RepID=A0A927CBR3_9BACL|nr:ATP-binding protein [Paenibacillus oceani]MBD2863346.1 response regulator [Paenibacillus oceani]